MAKSTFEKKVLKTAGWNPDVKIPIVQFDTVAEALDAGHYGDEADIMHAANATRRVRMDRVVRDTLGEDGATTVETLRTELDGYVYKMREPASGERKATSGKTKIKNEAAIVATGVTFSPAQIAALRAAGVLPPEA